MDSGELSRLYRSFYGLQLQLQGGGEGGEGNSFSGMFPLQQSLRQRPDRRATCAPFRFRVTATSRVCFWSQIVRNRNGELGVDWRIMGRVDWMRCSLSPERLQG